MDWVPEVCVCYLSCVEEYLLLVTTDLRGVWSEGGFQLVAEGGFQLVADLFYVGLE